MKTPEMMKYGAGITASAAFSFLKINIIGGLSTALFTIISFVILTMQCFPHGSSSGHAGSAVGFLLILFSLRPVAFTILACIIGISPVLLLTLGNKYILSKIINKIIKDKGESLLNPLIDRVLNSIQQRHPDLLKKGTDLAVLKLKMVQEIKDSKDNKWIRRITIFGLRKVKLDDIDFNDENLSVAEIIKLRIQNSLQNRPAPGRTFFWMIIGLQWLTLLLTYFRAV